MSIARSLMTMRAEVRRNAAATDDYGHPGVPGNEEVKDGVPCFVVPKARQRIVDGRVNAELEEFECIFPKDADLEAGDRVEQIKDRLGNVLFSGPFEIVTGSGRSLGESIDHLSFRLRRIV